MRCQECERSLKRVRQDYPYRESGLDNITLVGVPVYVCPRHGVQAVALGELALLHRDIAQAVLKQERPLRGAEIRFLRKCLGWSGADFAKHTGTKPETVSRWENGKAVMGPQADRLLRVLVARETPIIEYSVDVLAQVAADGGAAAPVRVELEKGPKGWKYRRGAALVTT